MNRRSHALICSILALVLILAAIGCSRSEEARQSTAVRSLLKRFGLASEGEPVRFGVTVPESWQVKLGEYPVGLYWAMVNEVSKDAGYDLTPLKGKTVTVWKAGLAGGLQSPEKQGDFRYPTDIIVLLDGRKVVGGWLSFNTGMIGPSLGKRWLDDITGIGFDQWIQREGFFADAGANADLVQMKPEEVMAAFFEAVEKGDETRALACICPRQMLDILMVNRRADCLYNPGLGQNNTLIKNIVHAKLLSWHYYEIGAPGEVFTDIGSRTAIAVALELELEWRDSTFNMPNYRDTRFINMYNNGLGWKFDMLATGP